MDPFAEICVGMVPTFMKDIDRVFIFLQPSLWDHQGCISSSVFLRTTMRVVMIFAVAAQHCHHANCGSHVFCNVFIVRVGAHNPGPKAMSMLELTRPDLNWVQLAAGMGVPGTQATTTDTLAWAHHRRCSTHR